MTKSAVTNEVKLKIKYEMKWKANFIYNYPCLHSKTWKKNVYCDKRICSHNNLFKIYL